MIKPTVLFEAHVPENIQSYSLVSEAERAFLKVYDHITSMDYYSRYRNFYSRSAYFISPIILLSDAIYENVNHYNRREIRDNEWARFNDLWPELDCDFDTDRYYDGADISEIVLYHYCKDCHTVTLYFKAIEKYANSHSLPYIEAYEYAMASALFQALHHERFPNSYIFNKHKKPISEQCNIVTCSLREFYAYLYCKSVGYNAMTRYLISTWRQYFFTTWPYAQALYYLFSKHRHLSDGESINKHYSVFSLTNSIYSDAITNAIDELHA